MKSNINYNKNTAKKFHDVRFYENNEFVQKNLEYMNNEKKSLKTKNREKVSTLIHNIKEDTKDKGKVFNIIEKIYEKNRKFAFNETDIIPMNSDLLNIIANEDLLLVSYNKIRRNRGATTKASETSNETFNSFNSIQKSFINKTFESPDGINMKVINTTSKLIKDNRYPWGTSRRIYVDKPGKLNSKRPITIPPFMDRVVQEALNTVLMAIYEPYFEKRNCSFGFRPNKGVHDAIVSLTGGNANGLCMAIEGDIKSAYDKVNRDILIDILGEKITDKKFLSFIRNRINYTYYDEDKKSYISDDMGLPQGGIDSPYLWNIYMMEFDEFIIDHITNKFEILNLKARGIRLNPKRNIALKEHRFLERKRSTLRKILLWFNTRIKDKSSNIIEEMEIISKKTNINIIKEGIFSGELHSFKQILKEVGIGNTKDLKTIMKNLFVLSKSLKSQALKLPSRDLNKLRLRFIYSRYADDWILITNAKIDILDTIKSEIAQFLESRLKATLSSEKTLITDIRKNSAHFLGFEIKTYRNKKIGKYKRSVKGKSRFISAITAGYRVFAIPDRQRLINRLHMKGYCNENGFPREIGFLSSLETFSIIERYNSVLTGISLYYAEFIRNPRRNLSRWIYIIRYSCFKTLAQKHKTSIREIFKKYKAPRIEKTKENTIMVKVINHIDSTTVIKTWRLKTTKELIDDALSLNRKKQLFDNYWNIQNGNQVIYINDKYRVTSDNYFDKLKWVNIRTKAAFDLPCSICGSNEDIEMHHLNHVKKNKYNLIDKEKTWEKMMHLRNRKQIPVCKDCHTNLIHKGRYGGTKLSYFHPKIMYDNRLISIESNFKNPNINKEKLISNLSNKGWKIINN